MFVRPRDLADRMSGGLPPETLKLPVDAERLKAREILHQFRLGGYPPIVKNRRQVPDGQIAFAIRHLPVAD